MQLPSSLLVPFVAHLTFSVATGSKIIEVSIETFHKYGELSLENLEKDVAEMQQVDEHGVVPMTNIGNMYYVGNISVGTPPKTFRAIFDNLLSPTLLMDKALCRLPEWKSHCEEHNEHDCKKSSTCKKTHEKFSIYSGLIKGIVEKEEFNFSNITVKNAKFGGIQDVSYQNFGKSPFDAIVGLAYPPASQIKGVEPMLVTMQKQKQVDSATFCVRATNCTCGCAMNSITFGGIDKKHCKGDIVWSDVIEKIYFKIKIEGAKLGSQTVLPSLNVTVNTALSLNYGPKTYLDKINKAIGGQKSGSLWIVDCNKIHSMPNITVMVSGKTLTISPWDYILQFSSTECVSTFLGLDILSQMYFSWPMIRAFSCTIFDMDNHRVGFSPK